MNRRRLIAAVFFSVVIVAVLALIVVTESINASQTVNVLRLKKDVDRGATFSPADVDQIPIKAQPGDFNYVTQPASGARYTLSLKNGDILRPDDLEKPDARVPVVVQVKNPPAINGGDSIDVFAPYGGEQVLIGHNIPVLSSSASNMTILVDTNQELAWIAVGVASESTPLHVTRSTTQVPNTVNTPTSGDTAIQILCGSACVGVNGAAGGPGAPAGASPTPAPAG